MEIERKYLIHKLPENLDTYPYKKITCFFFEKII